MSANQVRPRDEDDNKLIPLTIILVVLAVVLPVLAYVRMVGLEPRPNLSTPEGGILVEVTGNTTAEVILYTITGDPPVTRMKVKLMIEAKSSVYSFGSATNGTIATLESGPDLGTITYWDPTNNKEVNSGDKLLLTNLNKNSDYIVYLIWAPNGDEIEHEFFTTPP